MTNPSRALLTLLMVLLLAGGACSRKARPLPPAPPVPTPVERTEVEGPDSSLPRPLLEVRLEPPTVRRGESALLSWKAENATEIEISGGIGLVEALGRIRLFPEASSTYRVEARGPGGTISQEVTVEVVDTAEVRRGGITEEDLARDFEFSVRPVFFDYDSSELNAEAENVLEDNLGWLTGPSRGSIRVLLEGHCDQRGSEEYNLALGDRRAQVVFEYLIRRGIDASRLETVSLGEESPFSQGGSEQDFALNRRVQFVLLRQR